MRTPTYIKLSLGLVLTAALLFALPVSARETGRTYTNPVFAENFPDPSVLSANGTFYAYATNSDSQNMLCARSNDLVHWTALPDAMPRLPLWAKSGRTWAPVVRPMPRGGYIAYFTAWDAATDQQEIGVGTSAAPTGPFFSPYTKPLVAQPDSGGAIDPSCFLDSDGTRYLVWKSDGNSQNQDTWLWVQTLSADGLHLVGAPKKLIKQDQSWEGNLVEAPTVWKHGGKYYLFYSANDYSDCRYAVGYAVSASITGPYTKPRQTPWLAGTNKFCGPGGEDIVATPGGATWLVYHSWTNGPQSGRGLNIDKLTWNGDTPVLDGPSRSAKPVPVLL